MIVEGLSPGSLPPPQSVNQRLRTPSHISAYNVIYSYEQKVLRDKDKVIRARVVGFLLLLAPNDTTAAEVVRSIVLCQSDTALYELGDAYMVFYIRPFKKYKGSRTPVLSSHPSRSSFDTQRKEIKKNILQAPENHTQAKKQALFRDGYRCMVTKSFDFGYIEKGYDIDYPDAEEKNKFGIIDTQCAHIIPESTYFRLDDKRKNYASSVLAVLQHFGYEIDKFNGPKVHSLSNIMTLAGHIHHLFDQLGVWFEATGPNHSYELKRIHEANAFLRNFSPHVTFTTSDPSIPLPDPALLALHANCAKVAHLSRAGEYIDQVQRDMEDLTVLAEDGGSSDVLLHALYHSAVVGVEA